MTYQELSRQLFIYNAAEPGGPRAPPHPPKVFPAYFHPFKDSSKPDRAESLSQPSDRATILGLRGQEACPSIPPEHFIFPAMRETHSLQSSTAKGPTSQDRLSAQTLWPSPVYPLAPAGMAPSELQETSSPEIRSRDREARMPQRPWPT